MATITLQDVWVHLASDPATSITAMLTDEGATASIDGGVDRYAGGRLRSTSRPGIAERLGITCKRADRANVDQLRAWLGVLVMVRDPDGRKLWGVIYENQVTEIPGIAADVAHVSFTFHAITHSEAV